MTMLTRRTLRRSRALTSVAGLALTAFALTGCTRDLFADDSTVAQRLPVERLREIQPLRLDDFKGPPPAPDAAGAAATGTTPADPDGTQRLRDAFAARPAADLSLEEARASALERNLDLRVALLSPTIAAQRVTQEEARFESTFTTQASFARTDRPSLNSDGTQADVISIEPGVTIPLRTGGSASISLPTSRTDARSPIDSEQSWSNDLALSFSQPILRNAGRRAATAGIRIAGYNAQATEAQTKLEVIRQLANVDRAYWRLYQARAELEVRQRQYEFAKSLLDSITRRLNAGDVAEIEVIRAQAGLAERLEGIIVSQNTVLSRQRELKRLINRPDLPVEAPTLLVPSTVPDPVEYVIEPVALAERGVQNRMEMVELELRLAADAVSIGLEQNRALPLFTVDYTYAFHGLSSRYDRSLQRQFNGEHNDWTLGARAEIPLGNEQALARVREAILTRLQRLGTRQARELAIRQDVLDAVDALTTGWQRILASRQSAILNARALAAEQRNLAVGNSTVTNVLDQEARLSEARSAEVRALTDYQIFQIDLAFATGTLLGAAKVAFEPAAEPADLTSPVPETLAMPASTPDQPAPK
jgi:outer membrane protein TolC